MKKLILYSLPGVFIALLFVVINPYSKIGPKLFASERHKLIIEMARSGNISGTHEFDDLKVKNRKLIFKDDTVTYDVTVYLERFRSNEISIYIKSFHGYAWHLSSDAYGDIQWIEVRSDYQTMFHYNDFKFFFIHNKNSVGKKEFYDEATEIYDAVMDDLTKDKK